MRFATENSTSDAVAVASIARLNGHVAASTAAQLFSKSAHWNVKGDGFYSAHLLFDKVYELVQGQTDDLAERITALGGEVVGLPMQVAKEWMQSKIFTEISINASMDVRQNTRAMDLMLGTLANSYLAAVGDSKDDPVTQNLYLRLAEETAHMLYFLEANLRIA